VVRARERAVPLDVPLSRCTCTAVRRQCVERPLRRPTGRLIAAPGCGDGYHGKQDRFDELEDLKRPLSLHRFHGLIVQGVRDLDVHSFGHAVPCLPLHGRHDLTGPVTVRPWRLMARGVIASALPHCKNQVLVSARAHPRRPNSTA
jgi:hypothetical protein